MANNPKNWSIDLRLRGNELSLILDALEAYARVPFEGSSRSNEINEILRALTAKWEANA